MKAIVLTGYGDPDRLQQQEVPDPSPQPGEILVRVAGVSINPVDWKLRSGALRAWMPLDLPAVLGRDVSGIVSAVGPGVTAFAPGARVLGLVNRGYAQLVTAALDAWAEVPAEIDLVEAAALPLAGLTGAQLVEEAVGIREGEALLVTGATGSVGRAAVFAAKARGARVYAGVRKKYKAEAAKLGVSGVVALDDDAELDRLPSIDAIADTVGGETIGKLLTKLPAGGRIGSAVGEPAGAKERGIAVRAMLTRADGKRLGELSRAMAQGKLVLPIARRFPLAEAATAQRFAESGAAAGKVLLVV
jgi:NADPH:quinone reductase-like Zn-dependent oxidoreductase